VIGGELAVSAYRYNGIYYAELVNHFYSGISISNSSAEPFFRGMEGIGNFISRC
jgi:hypothetical protein